MTRLKLDFDGAIPRDLLDRVRALFRWVGGRAAIIEIRRSAHGWHVIIHTRAQWARNPVAVVAAQALLGSDPKREMFNLMRAVSLRHAPAFWRQEHRWNTIYRRKLKGATTWRVDSRRRAARRSRSTRGSRSSRRK